MLPSEHRLQRELAEQARWRPRPMFAAERLFTELVRAEFLDREQRAARRHASLSRILRHAAAEVPYWAASFERLGQAPADLAAEGGLQRLPVLSRGEVREQATALLARRPAAGEMLAGSTFTSGSTGQPMRIANTARSLAAFGLLRQRAMRWFRFDPAGALAVIQPGNDLPPGANGRVAPGEQLHRDSWFNVGHLFETGRCVGMDQSTPVKMQLDCLAGLNADYLLIQASYAEQLALAARGTGSRLSLRGVYGNSSTLTGDMRRTVEDVFGAPVHMGYGLNEFGIVAATCAEGGRYHFNEDHFVVEIVDAQGRPCRDGESGRLLVTGLVNTAMPLFRYETGDLATVVEGPCACGRTLATFTDVQGRYRRWAQLPEETYTHYKAVIGAMSELPDEVLRPLLRYQFYQRSDLVCELRVITDGQLDPRFERSVREHWRQAGAACGRPAVLEIRLGVEPFLPPGGKAHNLWSELYRDFEAVYAQEHPQPGRASTGGP